MIPKTCDQVTIKFRNLKCRFKTFRKDYWEKTHIIMNLLSFKRLLLLIYTIHSLSYFLIFQCYSLVVLHLSVLWFNFWSFIFKLWSFLPHNCFVFFLSQHFNFLWSFFSHLFVVASVESWSLLLSFSSFCLICTSVQSFYDRFTSFFCCCFYLISSPIFADFLSSSEVSPSLSTASTRVPLDSPRRVKCPIIPLPDIFPLSDDLPPVIWNLRSLRTFLPSFHLLIPFRGSLSVPLSGGF